MASISATTNSSNNCSFSDIQTFFDFASANNLNITQEVEQCQNLCLMTYGTGNPDLSGIGMMYAYTFQVVLTILFGPIFRTLFLIAPHLPWGSHLGAREVIASSADIQIVFWESNGFLIFASAVATLVRMTQGPTIFEIAEMQILMFVQLNSLLIMFFCLVHPIARWWQRFFQFLLGFALAAAALSQSRLTGRAETDYFQASLGCVSSPAFKKITPVPYHKTVVFVGAGLCALSFLTQSVTAIYPRIDRVSGMKKVLTGLTILWSLMTTLSLIGLIWGLVILWQQRNKLHSLAGEDFEDNQWGFGQIAALFTWIPIPVEISYKFNDWLKDRSETWSRLQSQIAPSGTGKDRKIKVMAPATSSIALSEANPGHKYSDPRIMDAFLHSDSS